MIREMYFVRTAFEAKNILLKTYIFDRYEILFTHKMYSIRKNISTEPYIMRK